MPRPIAVSYRNIDALDNMGGSIIINDFSGGLNTTDSNELLQDNEAIIRKSWSNNSRGAIEKVNGYTKMNSTLIGAKPIRGLFRYDVSAGTKKLLAVCNGGLYYSDDDGVTFTQEAGSVALTETVFCSGVNYNDLFFLTNKSNNLYTYTADTLTVCAAGDAPGQPCRILLKRSDRRLIAFDNDTNGSTLYFSKVDPTGASGDDFSAANDAGSIAIDGAKSERLTGGMTYGAVDIIFKDYAAFKIWGYPSPQVLRMSGSPGCNAPQSVAQGDGLGFHLAHDGVWMFDGNKFLKISDPIEDLIDGINSSYIQNAFGVYRNGYYWLFYTKSGQTTNQKCVVYDVAMSNPYIGKNVWYERDNLAMNCPVVFTGTGDDNELYAGTSANTGFVYRLDYSATDDDAGSNISATYQTKYYNAGMPHLVKRFSKVHITYYHAKGDLYVYWYTSKGAVMGDFTLPLTQTGAVLGSFVLGTDKLSEASENTHTERLPDTAIGKDISLKFYHNDKGARPIIRNVEVEWEALFIE